MNEAVNSYILNGKKVLITRPEHLSASLGKQLKNLGAEVIYFPTIAIRPPEDTSSLDQALADVDTYQWIIFTSVNGVHYFSEQAGKLGIAHERLHTPRVAAIGPATAEAAQKAGFTIDRIPEKFVAESLASTFSDIEGQLVLLPRADIARATLKELLEEKGAVVNEVTAYHTVTLKHKRQSVEKLFSIPPDILTFTSSSTVRGFCELIEGKTEEFEDSLICCIGPVTAETARESGLQPDIEAAEYTVNGITSAIRNYFKHAV